MKKCKYCGRILHENERCTCPKAVAMRRKVLFTFLLAIAVIAVIIIVAVVVSTGSSQSNPHKDPLTNADAVTSELSTTENALTPSDTEIFGAEPEESVTTSVEVTIETSADETEPQTAESTTDPPVILVDPFEYYIEDPTFDKYNGAATVSVATDAERLLAALIGEKPSIEDADAYLAYLDIRDEYYYAILSIDVDVTPSEGLSNGDEITVSVTVPDSLVDKVMNSSKTYVVSGIPEIQRVDILSMFQFDINGNISGKADIAVSPQTEDEYLIPGMLHIEPRYNLSSGDQVTITILDEYVEYLINWHNIIPIQTVKTIEVAPLAEYVTSFEQLPKDTLRELAQRFAEEEAAGTEDDFIFTYGEVTVYGYYFMSKKLNGSGIYHNIVEIIVSYDVYQYGEYTCTYYIPIRFYNVTQEPDGTVSIVYESGDSSTFNTDIDAYFSDYADNYTVTQIEMAE